MTSSVITKRNPHKHTVLTLMCEPQVVVVCEDCHGVRYSGLVTAGIIVHGEDIFS